LNELVYLKNDEAVCDSLQVAEKFRKNHYHVLRDIENLIGGISKIGETHYFKKTYYTNEQNGQRYPKYYMNRDGFSLLAMGFTGMKALEWKLQYISAFNQMENLIKEKTTETWIETRKTGKLTRKAETDTIQNLVDYAKEQGSAHADMLYMTYSKLANKMAGVQKRDEATVTQLNNLTLMENVILHIIDTGILTGKHYKDIYKDCKKRLETIKDLAYLEQSA
jgi:Rha family phage regulatory protein